MSNIKSFRSFTEERINPIVVTFGRFNPPTIGHEENIESIAKMAKGKPFRIYSSQSEDPKKNPLGYEEKIRFMRKMFPKYGRSIILDHSIKNIFNVASSAYDEGFTKLIVAVGSDRVSEFKKLLSKYDGVEGAHGYYKFKDGIDVVSTGNRDPDIDDLTGISTFKVSASKMRSAAAANDIELFSKGLPKTFKEVKELFNAVRKGMGLKECHEFKKPIDIQVVSEQREQYIVGELFTIGSVVYTLKNPGMQYIINERYSNYVVCSDQFGENTKFFIQDLCEASNE